MIAILVALLLPAPLAQDPAASPEAPPPGAAFIEVQVPRDPLYAGQVVELPVVLGLDAAFHDERLVPLLLRPLDLPLAVEVPWGTSFSAATDAGVEAASLSVNGTEGRARRMADREQDGRSYRAWEIRFLGIVEEPGVLRLAAPRLRFAWSPGFRDDFLRGRVPLARRESEVTGAEATLRILPLPDAGRPADFTGAVGRFRLRATCERAEVTAGESFRLRLDIEGVDAGLHRFPPPEPALPGFHVYGFLEERAPGRRTILYDLAALDATASAIPPLSLATFDPTPPAGWRLVSTEPIPLQVRPARVRPGSAPAPSGGFPWLLLVLPAALAAVIAGVLLRRRSDST